MASGQPDEICNCLPLKSFLDDLGNRFGFRTLEAFQQKEFEVQVEFFGIQSKIRIDPHSTY